MPAIHGRLVQIGGNDFMGARIGVGDMASALGHIHLPGHEGKGGEWIITGLGFEHAIVDAASINAGRRAGFQTGNRKSHVPQAQGQGVGWRIACPSGCIILITHVHAPTEKGPGSQNHLIRTQLQAGFRPHTRQPIIFH
jgi:hypothetical protein